MDDEWDEESEDELVKGPGKLKIDNFLTWKESLLLKLHSMKGCSGVPLVYVVLPDLPGNHDGDFGGNEEEQLTYETRWTTVEWNKDNKRVAGYILSLVHPTDGYKWIRGIATNDGRSIYQALTNHY